MTFLQYLLDKCFAVFFRTVTKVVGYIRRGPLKSYPDEVRYIPSRDAGRTIKVHVYRTSSAPGPSPVLINAHGSGFMLPVHGSDDEFCRQMSRETKCTVLDIQYRLAPENPFPAALNDVQDSINYALGRPDEFDTSRVSLSGFSAGGNLTLSASANLFPQDTFHCVIAIYPVTDLYTSAHDKVAPNPLEKKQIPPRIARFFDRCYVPASFDPRDPRISPSFAPVDQFPRRILMITADGDTLAPEAETLGSQLAKRTGSQVIMERMVGCWHGWDKTVTPGSPQQEAKERAYRMAAEMLNQ
ncbi:Alpha/beta hydrolase fold-3 [Penicillium herquei]|nr:Alpha/beta hydrolase fold-3 [Penicillium herquei]